MIKVPFVDLYAQYLTIQSEIDSAIERVIKNTSFIGGNEVKVLKMSMQNISISNIALLVQMEPIH
jgi:hypothetical protein